MKYCLLIVLSLFTFSLTAQVSIVDFEEDSPGVPDCIPTAEWVGDPNVPVVTEVTNPNTSGINTTANCVKFVETTGSAAGNSLQLAFNGTTSKTGHNLTANKFVKIMVYSENQTSFDILLELGTGGAPNFSQSKTVTTTLNTWTEVEFDFSSTNNSNWNSNIRIHFNNGTAGQGDTYYVDEYYITPTSTVVTPPNPPISVADFEDNGLVPAKPDANVTAEWINDPNLPVASIVANPNMTGANTTPNTAKFVETTGSNQNNSLQFAFDGTTAITGHDLINNKFVKVMVYSANQTNFDLLLELGQGGTPHFAMSKNISTTLNTWTEVEFDFSGADADAVINNANGWITNVRFHFNNGTAGQGDTYYVDEYQISETSTLGTVFTTPAALSINAPISFGYDVNSLMKKVNVQVTTTGDYAKFTLYAGTERILDNIQLPAAGTYDFESIVKFPQTGSTQLKFVATRSDITIQSFTITDYSGVSYPSFEDMTSSAGIVDETSLKYGGPTIADIDNDGDYDLVLNNHNDSPSKLYWNNGNETFTKLNPDLALWNMMDMHGSAAGDYDNDGDLDLLMSLGGGNGANPATSILYRNDNGVLTRVETPAGITSTGRGRSPRWVDMDMDGDLDLMLINAQALSGGSPRHIFYENNGDGTFSLKAVAGLEDANAEKLLVTDLNNDHIDDVVLLSPLSIWKGNGDFTFTDMSTAWLPAGMSGNGGTTAAVDVDIDNDGDLDLYLAKGEYYFTIAEGNTVDYFPLKEKLDMRISGSQGTLAFDVTANGSISIAELNLTTRNAYAGGLPLFLGSAMTQQTFGITDTVVITQAAATGFPATRTNNGIYIGHVGGDNWKVEVVRTTDIYWLIQFTMDSVETFTPDGFVPNNANQQDVLLRNDGGSFTNVSNAWKIPTGGNHWGVTKGDFNNDSYEDLYIYRFGYLKDRVADFMLLNTGSGSFETTTTHGASNAGASSHGDMGQAFDFNSDGKVDIFNGDDEFGIWYLYKNTSINANNYIEVNVGYAPNSNVDAISAEVTVVTPTKRYKKRVGSAGEAHSQSLLNIVHFGLGAETQIDTIFTRWRDGNMDTIINKTANQTLFALPVELLSFTGHSTEKGTQLEWITATELDNDKFEIQRSQNGENFETIGTVAGNGTTLEIQQYEFLDTKPEDGLNYYRLKQFDFDGQFEFSNIITVNYKDGKAKIGNLYPNPTNGKTQLDYTSNTNEKITITVFDISGKLVTNQTLQVVEGANNLALDFAALEKGIYIIQLANSDNQVYRKLVIE